MNMWHTQRLGQRATKVSVATGSKVPLREMMQRRFRREQQESASKNDALALRYGCSNLRTESHGEEVS